MKKRIVFSAVIVLPLLLAFATTAPVHAATQFVVNTTADEAISPPFSTTCNTARGTCSLRAAIQAANYVSGPSVITFTGGGFYTLDIAPGSSGNLVQNSADLEIANDITITGPGQAGLTITAGSGQRIFDIQKYLSNAPKLTLSGVLLSGGSQTLGGAAYVGVGATFNATDVTMQSNSAHTDGSGNLGFGGAIFNYGDNTSGGTVSLTRVTLDKNIAVQGGAIVNGYPATMTITDSTITNNQAIGQFAGAIRNTGNLTISGGTIQGNQAGTRTSAPTTLGGAAIYNGDPPIAGVLSTLNVTGTVFDHNTLPLNSQLNDGGALYNQNAGSATMTRVTLTNNTAYFGGAIENDQGSVTLIDSTLTNNTAFFGGGIYNNTFAPNGTQRTFLTAYRTTFNGNNATGVNCPPSVPAGTVCGAGGAIFSENSTTNINDSTLSGNNADVQGGGVYDLRIGNGTTALAIVSFINSTVASNTTKTAPPNNGGAGVWNNQGTVVYKNSIIANNTGSGGVPTDCYTLPSSVVTSNGNNLDSDNSCALTQSSDKHGNPNLDRLGNNGGPTQTMALLAGSPAIDAGDNNACTSASVGGVDQRGVGRPQGPICDIGAFEAVAAVIPPSANARPVLFRSGAWYFRNALSGGAPDNAFSFGAAGDTPLSCDADGNGSRSPAIVRPANGSLVWYTRTSNTPGPPDAAFLFGSPGDIPVCGDWDGNGTETPGLARPLGGGLLWILSNNANGSGPYTIFAFGGVGDTPVVGDWNGDKVASVGVVRSVGGSLVWYLRDTNSGGNPDYAFGFGGAGDTPVVGDWTGSGKMSEGIVRGTGGGGLVWYWRNTLNTGPVDGGMLYGGTGDVPLVWIGSGVNGQAKKASSPAVKATPHP